MIDAIMIAFIVLAILIIYALIRLRIILKRMPGATSKMNAIELIKNWQEQKARDAQRLEEIREKAKVAAQPKIEEALIEKYTQEEIAKATGTSTQGADAIRRGLGIDTNKIFSRENIDRVTGVGLKINPLDPGVDTNHMFDRDKIQQMAQGRDMSPERIKQASGHINYDEGIKRSMSGESQFKGLRNAVRRELKDKD